jgi:hypothetical protein
LKDKKFRSKTCVTMLKHLNWDPELNWALNIHTNSKAATPNWDMLDRVHYNFGIDNVLISLTSQGETIENNDQT